MTHIANQRIKKGGKYYAPGDPITLSEAEAAALPKGAVSPRPTAGDEAGTAPPPLSDVARAERLKAAVDALTEADFKKDGGIRADALRELSESLGFEVTADAVAGLKAASASGESG